MKNVLVGVLMTVAATVVQTAFGEEAAEANWGLMEQMRPDQLESVMKATPIAFVPLGTYEHHGWHLPIGFDAIKAYALSQRVAQRTGGVVLPPFFYGTGGGHVGYKWTIILPEEQIRPILETTLDQLSRFGFKVVVILTGHYPREQAWGSRGEVRDEHRFGTESKMGATGESRARTRSRTGHHTRDASEVKPNSRSHTSAVRDLRARSTRTRFRSSGTSDREGDR